ncbi:hypothetical protein GQ457_10G007030 [Hibiscus cannabinus]
MAVTSSCKEGTKIAMDNGRYVSYMPEQVEALERLYTTVRSLAPCVANSSVVTTPSSPTSSPNKSKFGSKIAGACFFLSNIE